VHSDLHRCLTLLIGTDAELAKEVEAPREQKAVWSERQRMVIATADASDPYLVEVTADKCHALIIVWGMAILVFGDSFRFLQMCERFWLAQLAVFILAPTVQQSVFGQNEAMLLSLSHHRNVGGEINLSRLEDLVYLPTCHADTVIQCYAECVRWIEAPNIRFRCDRVYFFHDLNHRVGQGIEAAPRRLGRAFIALEPCLLPRDRPFDLRQRVSLLNLYFVLLQLSRVRLFIFSHHGLELEELIITTLSALLQGFFSIIHTKAYCMLLDDIGNLIVCLLRPDLFSDCALQVAIIFCDISHAGKNSRIQFVRDLELQLFCLVS
jgi:hypothetical protein